MTDEAQQLAAQLGVDADMSAAHSATPLTEKALRSENLVLVLGMAREHRRRIVEFAPSKLKSTFTVREFARLAADTPDADIVASADAAGTDAAARLRAAVSTVAAHRGMSMPPADPADDDVIDPYRRSWKTYELSGSQLAPAIDQVVRVIRLAVPAAR